LQKQSIKKLIFELFVFSAVNISDVAPGEVVAPASIVNLTGKREWQAPPGNWLVLRMSHTSTGAKTKPSMTPGLECNKLSPVAVRHHIENMFDSGRSQRACARTARKAISYPFHAYL
jgi:hypothetical protein